jgi:Fe-S cluster assembly iron-binding protein IscA
MLTITQGAEAALATLRDSVDGLPDTGGVRIAHASGLNGDSTFSLELVEHPEADDVVLSGHPISVFVERTAAELLEDAALDGESHGDHVHFGFVPLDGDGDGDGDGPTAA